MKKESKFTSFLEWTIMLVLLFGIVKISNLFGFGDQLKPDTRSGKILMMIGIFVMAFVVLAVHELGHLIVGLVNGFKFELFVIGPLGIKKENDKVKIYFNKNLGYYGGVAATSPVDDIKDNAKIFAKILLAGPIASILFAFFCFVISSLIGKPFGIIFYGGGIISIGIFLATTIPSRTGMFFTDRKRYQRLVTPGKDQLVELAMLKIIASYSKYESYKYFDENDIDLLVSDELPFIKFFGLYNRVCFELENNGVIGEKTSFDYEDHSKMMSKNLVVAFNKEIEKLKERLQIQSDDVTSK